MLFGEKLVLAAAGGAVYYYSDPIKVRSIQFNDCKSITQIVAQPRPGESGSFDIYAIGKNNSNEDQLFTAYISFNSRKTVDADKVDSVELSISDIESAVCGGSCYYFKDKFIYNSETGQKKNLGDINVRQMEYSPDDNSLILATDDGVRILDARTFDTICWNNNVQDVRFVSRRGPVVGLATQTGIYAAYKSDSGLSAPILAGEIGNNCEIAGVVIDDSKLYALGKTAGRQTGLLSSASIYYTRDIMTGGEDGEHISAKMAFPVMPFMAETSSGTALGISAG